jgi:hypothetical protein
MKKTQEIQEQLYVLKKNEKKCVTLECCPDKKYHLTIHYKGWGSKNVNGQILFLLYLGSQVSKPAIG